MRPRSVSTVELLATIKETREDRPCACDYAFLGFYGLFGWVHLGMVHRCLTTHSCHRADTLCALCNNTLMDPAVANVKDQANGRVRGGGIFRQGNILFVSLVPQSPLPDFFLRNLGPFLLPGLAADIFFL